MRYALNYNLHNFYLSVKELDEYYLLTPFLENGVYVTFSDYGSGGVDAPGLLTTGDSFSMKPNRDGDYSPVVHVEVPLAYSDRCIDRSVPFRRVGECREYFVRWGGDVALGINSPFYTIIS